MMTLSLLRLYRLTYWKKCLRRGIQTDKRDHRLTVQRSRHRHGPAFMYAVAFTNTDVRHHRTQIIVQPIQAQHHKQTPKTLHALRKTQ